MTPGPKPDSPISKPDKIPPEVLTSRGIGPSSSAGSRHTLEYTDVRDCSGRSVLFPCHGIAHSSASIAAAQSLSLARKDFWSVVSGTLVA